MRYFLYTFEDNWADEMDLAGFAAINETQKDMSLASIKRRYKNGGTIGFGTNEDNEYSDLDEVLSTVDFKEITLAEYNTLHKLFSVGQQGELGPLKIHNMYVDEDEDVDEDEEPEYCDECGEELEDGETELCQSCMDEADEEYEEQYREEADQIVNYIKTNYGLEHTIGGGYHAQFNWKPTSNTEIEILVPVYDDGQEEIELILRLNGRELRYEFYDVEEVANNPGKYLKNLIAEYIEKAKKH